MTDQSVSLGARGAASQLAEAACAAPGPELTIVVPTRNEQGNVAALYRALCAALGSINWELLATLLLGSVPGITIGSLAARAVPEKILRVLLAATLTGVAAKLVF